MSAAYGFAFLVLAALAGASAAALWADLGGVALVPGYFAATLGLLSAAYFGAGPHVFLKRATGRIPVAGWILFGPYFLLNILIFRIYRVYSSEPPCVELLPNLHFGRRLSPREARSATFLGVLDLAAEFGEVSPLRGVKAYHSLPALDATAPTREQLDEAVGWLRAVVREGPVYVHCAMGHGRTACVVVAYLLAAGVVGTAAEGLRMMRALRPGVRLNRAQREALRPYEAAKATSA